MKINLYFNKFLFFVALSVSSCATGVPTEKIDYNYAFCDGNSKVWMLQKVKNGYVILDEKINLGGEFIVFYLSGKVVIGTLANLGKKKGKIGSYKLDNENNFVTLDFSDEKWDFSFEFSNEERLLLYPTTESDFIQTLELVPFPEL